MAKAQKNRASKAPYVSPNQLELVGFESPFTKNLDAGNRWVKLAKQIPWDMRCTNKSGQSICLNLSNNDGKEHKENSKEV